jgi:hypothetical protein
LKNQNKRKKETKKYKETKIRLSKVTNTQKKVVKKNHKQMRLITKIIKRKRRQKNYVLFENLHP